MISFRIGALVAGGGVAAGGLASAAHLGRRDEPSVGVTRFGDRLIHDFDVRSTRGNRDGTVDIAREGVRIVRGKNPDAGATTGGYGTGTEPRGSIVRRTDAVALWRAADARGTRDGLVTRSETRAWLGSVYDRDRDGRLDHAETGRLRGDYPSAFSPVHDLA